MDEIEKSDSKAEVLPEKAKLDKLELEEILLQYLNESLSDDEKLCHLYNTFKFICSGSSFLQVRFQGHFWVVEHAECDDSGNGNTVEMFVNFGMEEVN